MSPRQKKIVKLETKALGYALVMNAMVWINILWYQNFKGGNFNACADITKYALAAGIILLLGRKAISEIIIKILESSVKK